MPPDVGASLPLAGALEAIEVITFCPRTVSARARLRSGRASLNYRHRRPSRECHSPPRGNFLAVSQLRCAIGADRYRALLPRRTPSASSAASSRTASTPVRGSRWSSSRRMNAEPTITPSEKAATSAAWSPVETPRPTPTGASVACRVALDQGPAGGDRVAGAGDAHERGGVDEAAAGLGGQRDALVGGAERDQEHAAEGVGVGGGEPGLGLLRDEVRGDEPLPPTAASSRGEAVDAVVLDRVPVRHDQRGRAGVGDGLDGAETSAVVTPPASAWSTAAWMTGPSITGSEYGRPTSMTSQPPSTMAAWRRSSPRRTGSRPAGSR